MKLQPNSTPTPNGAVRRATVILRVSHQRKAALVLVAELESASVRDWEATKNTAFWKAFQTSGIAVNAVVLVSSATLPRLPGGMVDAASVLAQFSERRGFLREELTAWIVNRLCEILYFTPGDFDSSKDWARHGVDSAVALELVADLEDRLGVRLPQALAECRNPDELVKEASKRLLNRNENLPWWRSPWVTTESM